MTAAMNSPELTHLCDLKAGVAAPIEMGEALGGAYPRFETGDSRYAWLNDITCVGTGMRRAGNVHVSVFDVG